MNKTVMDMAGRPFTGAWIETREKGAYERRSVSRPFTGAWIETGCTPRRRKTLKVAPSRGRGLKLH